MVNFVTSRKPNRMVAQKHFEFGKPSHMPNTVRVARLTDGSQPGFHDVARSQVRIWTLSISNQNDQLHEEEEA